MAENIDGDNPFASGGHRWIWGPRPTLDKRVGALGTYGEARTVLRRAGRPGVIVGVLRVSGESDRADADAAMTAIEDSWEGLITEGGSYSAEDDQGHSIDALSVDAYRAIGPRQYGQADGGNWDVWQRYEARVTNLTGAWLP